MPTEHEQSFHLAGKTYYPESLTIETWKGRHKDDYYDYDRLPADEFLTKMVEAAKEEGRREVRDAMKKSLGIS